MSKFKSLPEEVDIICLTGGKCGSSTLENTFLKNGYKCFKAHSKNHFNKIYNQDLIEYINNCSSKKELYLIDSYRTPIERKISSFFQDIKNHVPDYKNKTSEELIDIFNSEYINKLEEYHTINSIMTEYGLEPFDKFDFDKKYIIKKKGNLIFIKILFSDIIRWENILSEIFKKRIILYNSNLSIEKNYISEYNDFKRKYKVSQSYINNILKNDKQFKIFNTKEQQEKYINKYLESTV